jgi:hypothetical protein
VKKRYSPRKATTGKVTLSSGARVGEGAVVDLTVPGCLIETGLALEPGQIVQLRVYLDPKRPMRIDLGVVRWTKDNKVGIEFIRMTEADQLRLRFHVGYVEQRTRQRTTWDQKPLCVGF